MLGELAKVCFGLGGTAGEQAEGGGVAHEGRIAGSAGHSRLDRGHGGVQIAERGVGLRQGQRTLIGGDLSFDLGEGSSGLVGFLLDGQKADKGDARGGVGRGQFNGLLDLGLGHVGLVGGLVEGPQPEVVAEFLRVGGDGLAGGVENLGRARAAADLPFDLQPRDAGVGGVESHLGHFFEQGVGLGHAAHRGIKPEQGQVKLVGPDAELAGELVGGGGRLAIAGLGFQRPERHGNQDTSAAGAGRPLREDCDPPRT